MGIPLGKGTPTLQLNVSYKRFTPLLQDLKIVTTIEKIQGKKVYMRGRLQSSTSEEIYAEGQALFYCMSDVSTIMSYERARVLFGRDSRLTVDEALAMITRTSKL
mgnify:CR=1 FL=1